MSGLTAKQDNCAKCAKVCMATGRKTGKDDKVTIRVTKGNRKVTPRVAQPAQRNARCGYQGSVKGLKILAALDFFQSFSNESSWRETTWRRAGTAAAAGRADGVAKQLTAAQAVILKDREICK